MKEAQQLLQNQNFAPAVISFQNILQNEPDNFQARLGLAIALLGIEKYPEASREIAKLLARSPKNPQLLEMAARTFWQQRRFVEAEIVLQRRLALGGERAELWALYGDTLDARKKTAEAVSAYEKAVGLDPESIVHRYALGSLYWKQIRYEEAEREFLEILRRKPGEPRASFNLGDIYLTKGNFEKALPLLQTAAEAFPNEFDTRFALGRAHLAAGSVKEAIAELEAAVKLRPEIAEGFYQLGLALQRDGQREKARQAFEQTKKLQQIKRENEGLTKPM